MCSFISKDDDTKGWTTDETRWWRRKKKCECNMTRCPKMAVQPNPVLLTSPTRLPKRKKIERRCTGNTNHKYSLLHKSVLWCSTVKKCGQVTTQFHLQVESFPNIAFGGYTN